MTSEQSADAAVTAAGDESTIRPRALGDRVLTAVAAAALWMPAYQLWLIVSGTHQQSNDYFWMLGTIYNERGDFRWKGLLIHGNEHLVAIPKLMYAVNYELFGGSNISLGIAVWLISAAAAAVLAAAIWRTWRPSAAASAVLMWALCACLFPLQAQHNFRYSMSGAAWLTANLFSICAISAYTANRTYRAAAAGVLAVLSYGTGLVVWVPLTLWALRRRRPADFVLLAAGAAAVAGERATSYHVDGHPALELNPLTVMVSTARIIGALFTEHEGLALVVGLLVGSVLLGGMIVAFRRPDDRLQSLAVGLGLYAAGAITLIAVARTGMGSFGPSRYMGLVALVLLAAVLLWWRLLGDAEIWRLGSAVMVVFAVAAGSTAVLKWSSFEEGAALRAAAVRLGVGHRVQLGFQPESTALLSGLRHYPFNDSFDADCGLLDAAVDPDSVAESADASGMIDSVEATANPDAVILRGKIPADAIPDCVVALDGDSRVAGIGVIRGLVRPTGAEADGQQPMRVLEVIVARGEAGPYRVVAVQRGEPELLLVADVDIE